MNILSRIQRLLDRSESDFKLIVSETDITLTTPDGERKCVAWVELEEVSAYMISYSVVSPCIFWHLKSRTVDLGFPDRACGSQDALRVIHNLTGFDSLLYSQVFDGRYSEPVVVWRKDEK